MALSKEVPEFDIDDEVLLMETGIDSDSMSNDEGAAPPSVRSKSKHSASLNNTNTSTTRGHLMPRSCISTKSAFPHCSPRRKKFILRACRKVAIRPGASA
jgi:hypothetical protein